VQLHEKILVDMILGSCLYQLRLFEFPFALCLFLPMLSIQESVSMIQWYRCFMLYVIDKSEIQL